MQVRLKVGRTRSFTAPFMFRRLHRNVSLLRVWDNRRHQYVPDERAFIDFSQNLPPVPQGPANSPRLPTELHNFHHCIHSVEDFHVPGSSDFCVHRHGNDVGH